MDRYRYSYNYFINSEIMFLLKNYLSKSDENRILQIYSYEGLSTVFFADNFLDNSKSPLICVEPIILISETRYSEEAVRNSNFNYNISICKNSEKIKIIDIKSKNFFKENNKHFIYIDTCIDFEYQIKDNIEKSFNILEKNGIL